MNDKLMHGKTAAAERARAEPAEPPEGLRATLEAAMRELLCQNACRVSRPPGEHDDDCEAREAPAYVPHLLAALSLYRWQSAAAELRLRRALEDVERTDRAALAELEKMGVNLDDDCEGMRLRRKVADALATQPSPSAAALAELAALPGKARAWARHPAHHDAPAVAAEHFAEQLAALLLRCGLEPKP